MAGADRRFDMHIATEPPAKTVYQRILKPFPSVTLTTTAASQASDRYFRRRCEADEDIPARLLSPDELRKREASYAEVQRA